jgi:putative ABC transport system permease protein
MFWTIFFVIGMAQGIFLLTVIPLKGKKNIIAARIISVLLALMVLSNFGYFVIRTTLANYIPQFFAIPFGFILLFGPLFFFYSQSIIDPGFRWKKEYWLHFIPYGIQVYINLPLLTAGMDTWNWFGSCFLAGNLPIETREKIIFALQDVHLLVYLLFTFRWMKKAKSQAGNSAFIIPMIPRIKWLQQLMTALGFFAATVISLFLFILIKGSYQPVTNYIYTLLTSAIIYFIAYKLVLNPEVIMPDFLRKYRVYMQFDGKEGDIYICKLKELMEEKKVYLDTELKLASLAEQAGLPPHQLSKLINEKFGKTFSDYVNEYRVKEFLQKMANPGSAAYTIYGLALESGFSNKSSFNTAFKKITGKTPSEVKATS